MRIQDNPERYHIKWENISDYQKTSYGDKFDELVIELLADVLVCNLSFCVTISITTNLIVFTELCLSLHV